MKAITAYLKVISFSLYVLISFTFYMLMLGLRTLFRLPFEPWRNVYMRHLSKVVCFIFNIKVRKHGTPPSAPFYLVCNHLSYLDIIPLFMTLDCTFIAKKEIRSWPVLGYMVHKMGVVFVNRQKRSDVVRVNQIIQAATNQYQGIIVFPEGTSSAGRKVLPLKSSLLQYPASTQQAVHAAALRYKTGDKDTPAIDSVCFFGGRHSFMEHFMLMAKNKRIECHITFDENPVIESDRKLLTQKLREKISGVFIPTAPPLEDMDIQRVRE